MSQATQDLCHQAKVSIPSTEQLVNGLYKANNYDGLKAYEDWKTMNSGERVSKAVGRDFYIFGAGAIFSAYHCLRISSLSKSGKVMAPAGLAFSVFMLMGVATTKATYRSLVAKSSTE